MTMRDNLTLLPAGKHRREAVDTPENCVKNIMESFLRYHKRSIRSDSLKGQSYRELITFSPAICLMQRRKL